MDVNLSAKNDETHYMLVHPKGTPSAQMEVTFNGHTLTQVHSTRSLGFIIDDILFSTEHINTLSSSCLEDRWPLARWTLTGPVIERLYVTVIQPDLLYGALAFYHRLELFTSLLYPRHGH